METSKIVIADSGSTKTDWVYVENGRVASQFQTAGINPYYLNISEIDLIIAQQVVPEVPNSIDEIHFYGAGCANADASAPIAETLRHKWPSLTSLTVASDMLGAARGLCGHQPGIACILGTGANNAVFDGNNISGSVGSLGFWLGDEGSGSYLGKMLVVSYLQQELPQELHALFQEEFPEVNRMYILDKAYKQATPNRFFATFTHFIAQHQNLPFVEQFVATAFKLFIHKYILKHKEAKHLPIHFAGSVAFYFKEVLIALLKNADLQVGKIEKSPLQGLIVYHSSL